ncbi:MAG: hypothetical protein AB7P02_03485 [Alphaproteobacteria bacterium]
MLLSLLGGARVAAVLAALAAAAIGWALVERAEGGRFKVERDRARADADRLAAAVAAGEREMARRQQLVDAADRWVVAVERGPASLVRTRIVTIVREVAHAPDAKDRPGPALRLALDRLRALDAIDRHDDARDPAGAAARAPRGARPPAGAP